MLTKFRIKHDLVHLYPSFEFDNWKFAQGTQFREKFQKIQNLKKFARSNRFWSNSIPKVFDWCLIFACIFRMIGQVLRELELPQTFFKKIKIP